MTRQEFIDKHSEAVAEVYDEMQLRWQYDYADPGDGFTHPDDVD